ncbi:phosphatidylglycerol lysyltransferase domain-containing protein [Tsukamurella strandjordii]|uniref:Phosphatidylglycerol lysyltransferase domain-containing protein n=1 Tax=Tsukamurella strandjordii TaxID=147577 RepID=A0AA90N8R0_9ACTN|nr:phosphatidylglycerol lysyltransferase domain-containing protein [Tsukamurella strandjordii]MDP0397083.1 phosphatidylglycerol lysyltransferase domain-containing protein [Tsukamurella strandjordii]
MSFEHESVEALVRDSIGDPLAPFALRPEKLYVSSPDGRAVVAYAVRLGVAVASGDPVGADAEARDAAIDAFVRRAGRRPIAVLGAGEAHRRTWEAHGLHAVPIGRDVVIETTTFHLTGRRFRNLRQAIARTRNAGVTVEIVREGEFPESDTAAVLRMERAAGHDPGRGFSMILGRMLDGAAPDAVIALARTAEGTVCAAHRYLPAGPEDLSLDEPLRAPGAPNGVDERLTDEVLAWARDHGYKRVSLAFAPFPDLFSGSSHPVLKRAAHAFDPLIHVERLYRYLRKYHSFDQERAVLLRWHQLPRVAAALLLLEFGSYGRRTAL